MRHALDHFLSYAAAADPQFPQRIAGASPEEVRELQSLAGYPLPEHYIVFLAYMGRNDGGLKLAFEGTTEIGAMLSLYRRARQGSVTLPERSIVIGMGGLSIEWLVLYPADDAQPGISLTEEGRPARLYAESLEKALFRSAFQRFRMPTFPCSGIFTGNDVKPSLEPIRHCLMGEGYSELWFADAVTWCAEGPHGAVAATQYAGSRATLIARAERQEDIDHIGRIVGPQAALTQR